MFFKCFIGSIIILAMLLSIPLWYNLHHVCRFNNVQIPHVKKDVAIVLGAAVHGDKPSPALRERLNMAKKLYRDKKTEIILLCGGTGRNKQHSEAAVMKNYLMLQGIPEAALLLEDNSKSTSENLFYAKDILQKKQLSQAEVYVITHDYHMHRAIKIAKRAGITAHPAPVHSDVLFTPYHKFRECYALFFQRI